MTERKPPGVRFESWVDRQIREAHERGEFDDLPGAGQPLPGAGKPYDENWWIRDKLRREGCETDLLLPPSLLLRKEVERLPAKIRELGTEGQVRDTVAELNRRIAEHLRAPSGPHVAPAPVDPDEVVERWRGERGAPASPAPVAPPERRRGRLRRILRR